MKGCHTNMKRTAAIVFFVVFIMNISGQELASAPAKYANVSISDDHWITDNANFSFSAIAQGTRFAFLGRVDRIASSNDGSSGPTSSYISWLARLTTLSDSSKKIGSRVNLVFIFRDMPVIERDDVVVIYAEYTGRTAGDTAPWTDTMDSPLFHGEYYVCNSGFKNF